MSRWGLVRDCGISLSAWESKRTAISHQCGVWRASKDEDEDETDQQPMLFLSELFSFLFCLLRG
jgi:hypothetical protein